MAKAIDIKNDIEQEFRKSCDNKSIKLPESMSFTKAETGNKTTITITLPKDAITTNMQDNKAAFEGWAFAVYTHTHYAKAKPKDFKIELELNNADYDIIPKNSDYLNHGRNGHVNRFLYRALRFSQQYKEWFSLSENLKAQVQKFEEYLYNNTFINNSPEDDKETKEENGYITEKFVEKLIEKQIGTNEKWKNLVDSDGKIFRQLPVGLFKYNGNNVVENKDRIFTGGSSAIDLWSCKDEDIINIFELKYDNRMIGIITEIFFYCNYVRDMYCKNGMIKFKCNKGSLRGYDRICKKNFKAIKGFMLYDDGKLHPLITSDLIKNMNENKAKIEYAKIAYTLIDIECNILIK